MCVERARFELKCMIQLKNQTLRKEGGAEVAQAHAAAFQKLSRGLTHLERSYREPPASSARLAATDKPVPS